jgi:hypothetical protein
MLAPPNWHGPLADDRDPLIEERAQGWREGPAPVPDSRRQPFCRVVAPVMIATASVGVWDFVDHTGAAAQPGDVDSRACAATPRRRRS